MRLPSGLERFRRLSAWKQLAAVLIAVAGVLTATREVVRATGGTANFVGGIFGASDDTKDSAIRTPDDPRAFATQFLRLFFGEPSRYWELLNPEEKKVVSEKDYVECLDPPTGLVSVRPFDIYRGPIAHGPWARDGTQVTKVTLKTTLRTPDDKLHTDKPSVLLVREEGRWTGLLKDYEYTAHKSHRCPAYRTVAVASAHPPKRGNDRGRHTAPTPPPHESDQENPSNAVGSDGASATGTRDTDGPGGNLAASKDPPSTDRPGHSTAAYGKTRKTIPVGPGG
jgi:hypothetical protein